VIFLRAQRWPTDQWQQATALMNWGLSLRAGTAPVGHLDAPVNQPGSTPVSAAAHARASRTAAAAAVGGSGRDPVTGPAMVATTLAVLATIGLALKRRRYRRRRAPARR
jgi:D-alanyl-D-alanine carboxypeptidase (penicillin-binding protein 5/6)